jgi:hypothetical protein
MDERGSFQKRARRARHESQSSKSSAPARKTARIEIVRGGVPLPSIRNYFMLPTASATSV